MPDAVRFWSKVNIGEADACWPWAAAIAKDGYGQFWNPLRRTMDLAHRVAYEMTNGPLPAKERGIFGAAGTVVMHTCDNPPCCNPAHLVAATQFENMQDCFRKGRLNRKGERNSRALLTEEVVAEIRAGHTGRHGDKMRIARQYGISSGHVSKILAGQVWA